MTLVIRICHVTNVTYAHYQNMNPVSPANQSMRYW